MTQTIIEKKKNISGGEGGNGTNVKLKRLGAIYTKQGNSVHVLCHLLYFHCQRGGKNIGGVVPHNH